MNPNPQDAALIDQIASQAMGVAPQASAPQAPQAPPEPPPTREEKATEEMAGGDAAKMVEEAIAYELDFGGKKRRLTPQQIVSTFDRYGKLNHQHAAMKPVIELTERIMEMNPGATPEQVAAYVLNMVNGQNGKPPVQTPAKPAEAENGDDDPLAAWERENAATLPPGYRDLMGGNKQLQQRFDAIENLLRQTLASAGGMTDAARAAHQDARSQQASALQRSIANNLDRFQQELGLSDDRAEDFMVFAAERGYSMEDFIDPRLAKMVMTDFKNSMDSPEMERLRAIAQRRQSFTGSMGTTPAAAPAAVAPAEAPSKEQAVFDSLTNATLKKRGLAS